MLARAAAAHIEVMEMLLAKGAEPSLIDNDGGTVDAHNIVETYKALARYPNPNPNPNPHP